VMDRMATTVDSPVQFGCPYKQVYADVFYLYTCAITPVALLGIILNVINVVVLRQIQNAAHTSVFLLRLLAGCDLFFLTMCLVYFSVRHITSYIINRDEVFGLNDVQIGPKIFWATLPWYFIPLQTRNWLVVMITFERFLNIVFPLWARSHCNNANLSKVFAVVVVSALACHLPRYFSNGLMEYINPCTDLQDIHVYSKAWNWNIDKINLAMVVFVPLFSIYIMNIILLITLRRAMSKRSAIAGTTGKEQTDRGQRQATLTVISLVIVYTICETPASIDVLVWIAGIRLAHDDIFVNYSRKIGLFLIVVDSSVNFIAYCSSNSKFRQGLYDLVKIKAMRKVQF
jgi:hypothetical protein